MKLNFCQLNRMKSGLNATSSFAKLGDEEQVGLLLEAGGKQEDAVYGFALGGFTDKVNSILSHQPQLLIHAARGYARADNLTEIEKLGSSNEAGIKEALLEGHAQAGNKTQVNAALRSRNSHDYMPTLVKGLAEVGQQILEQYIIKVELQNVAISSAALSGNEGLVNQLLALQKIELSRLVTPLSSSETLALGHALVGYSKGRHYEHIEKLLQFDINPMLCLTAIEDEQGLIHGSDIQALCSHISDKKRQQSLRSLIKEQYDTDAQTLSKEDFSSDSELEVLLTKATGNSAKPHTPHDM